MVLFYYTCKTILSNFMNQLIYIIGVTMQKGISLASKLWIWQPLEIRTRRLENCCEEIYKGKIPQPPLPRATKFEPSYRERSIFFLNDHIYQY